MIYRNGRHLYDMSGGGSGRRWWQCVQTSILYLFLLIRNRYVVLHDAENKTWVDKDTTRTFYAQLLQICMGICILNAVTATIVAEF